MNFSKKKERKKERKRKTKKNQKRGRSRPSMRWLALLCLLSVSAFVSHSLALLCLSAFFGGFKNK